ncbi:MAG: single-stranded-DNA-specific exonuclease RecJ, partial [Eggerthellaceae bacterium]|nr:single-stranded-DNA-specific exonuclease RecJ [Eggerthellaceae bacterium]
MPAQFNVSAVDRRAVDRLKAQFGLPNFIATIMVARGITTPEEAERFLTPSLDRDWLNPYEIEGMQGVVDALEQAVRDRRHIVVFGDFDLDGISATTVLTRGLRALGGWATPFIPRRFDEGYGLTAAAFERVRQMEPELLVTVDCGISCKNEIEAIQAEGVDVVVTDHHEPGDQCPVGIPLVDPKTVQGCPSAILAGVGVALKVVQALGGRFGFPHLWRSYTDLATLGTVADLMPMRDENRALVADGLNKINGSPRPCIAALLGQAGVSGKPVTATSLSFSLIPRLNAAGRMGDASIALDLLMTDDFDDACKLAAKLEATNDARRSIEAELSEVARAKALEVYHGQRALIVAGEGWHEGVKGIVASRLVHTYGVPCLLFTVDGDEARGSGRTVGSVNLFKAVESCEDLLTRFGGHEAAVGVTLPASNLKEFSARLCSYMDRLPEEAFHPLIEIDACVSLDELTFENVEKLDALAPFGQENRVPCLLTRDGLLSNARAVGAEKNHFSCVLSDGRAKVSGIMFHCTDIDLLTHTDCVVNAAFEVQIDEWRGRRSVKAMLKSLAPAQACAALEACLDPHNTGFMSDLYATSDEDLCASEPENPADVEAYEIQTAANREAWERRAQAEPGKLEADVIRTLIGGSQLHQAQREVLDSLKQGQSTLCVMATGRGKSLTFHVHAAGIALRDHAASLFVYPLRALIADQAFHLRSALSRFGISVSVLTGECTPEERAATYRALEEGTCDIVLSTPEFLSYHADKLAQSGRIKFVVVDEAHHIGLAKAGNREAYATLDDALSKLGDPVVLALTATADGAVARDIAQVLPIDTCVFDQTERENLVLDDRRGLKAREDYLANLVAGGGKTIIYVNSREQSVALARQLRLKVPQLARLIGFYNAGLSRSERTRIEEMFRTGHLSVLVATSAFGEGVNIPDIRHVVLYHLPYNGIEFNQMSGRAGRDGAEAGVHLLYGSCDAETNQAILRDMTPDRNRMVLVYKYLRDLSRPAAGAFFAVNSVEIADALSARSGSHQMTPTSVDCAIAVFRELGLVE